MRKGGKMFNEVWETFRAMSVDVGKQIPFLADVSCMNEEERLNLAYCQFLQGLFESDDPEFCQFIEEIAKPFFKFTGRAKWDRDIVTDLGLALSLRKERKSSIEKVMEFSPSGLSEASIDTE